MVNRKMIKPLHLQAGATIAIVAPSSPIDKSKLEKGVAAIESRGYKVVSGKNVLAAHPVNNYLAGLDADRAADLNEMFARPDIDAIFSAGGGYGTARILPLLHWDTIRYNPKIFVGFSDLTCFHIALQLNGIISIHGKMAATLTDLDEASTALFWDILEKPHPYGALPSSRDTIQTIVPGLVEAELAGGCLCLMAHACGTPYAPDFTDKLVLIEDVGEAVYRGDRDLNQLVQAAHLHKAAGFIIGDITGWEKQEQDSSSNSTDILWRSFFKELGKPAISGFPFGHIPNPLTIPLGIKACLDATNKTVSLLESPVS